MAEVRATPAPRPLSSLLCCGAAPQFGYDQPKYATVARISTPQSNPVDELIIRCGGVLAAYREVRQLLAEFQFLDHLLRRAARRSDVLLRREVSRKIDFLRMVRHALWRPLERRLRHVLVAPKVVRRRSVCWYRPRKLWRRQCRGPPTGDPDADPETLSASGWAPEAEAAARRLQEIRGLSEREFTPAAKFFHSKIFENGIACPLRSCQSRLYRARAPPLTRPENEETPLVLGQRGRCNPHPKGQFGCLGL